MSQFIWSGKESAFQVLINHFRLLLYRESNPCSALFRYIRRKHGKAEYTAKTSGLVENSPARATNLDLIRRSPLIWKENGSDGFMLLIANSAITCQMLVTLLFTCNEMALRALEIHKFAKLDF